MSEHPSTHPKKVHLPTYGVPTHRMRQLRIVCTSLATRTQSAQKEVKLGRYRVGTSFFGAARYSTVVLLVLSYAEKTKRRRRPIVVFGLFGHLNASLRYYSLHTIPPAPYT